MSIKLLLIAALIFCLVGSEMYNNGIEKEKFENTLNNITYENLGFKELFSDAGNEPTNTFVKRAIYKFCDFLAYFTLGEAKEAMTYGYEHPQYNYDLAWKLLFLSLFAAFVVPLIHLLCFIGYAVVAIKNKIKERKKNGI